MSKTKSELITAAMTEIGIAEYEFDIAPEEITTGIRRLDAMLAQWSARGAVINYPFGELDGNVDSGIPDIAEEAVVTNLAVRLASSYGKQPDPVLLGRARMALSAVYSLSARPREQQLPSMPRGAGHKMPGEPFTQPPDDPYLDVVDLDVDLTGGPDGGT